MPSSKQVSKVWLFGAGRKLKRAIESAADDEIRERLMKAYIATDQLLEAGEQAEQLARIESTSNSYLRAISVWMHAKSRDRALQTLIQAMRLFPDAPELQAALSALTGHAASATSSSH
jgi:hypothetical protein